MPNDSMNLLPIMREGLVKSKNIDTFTGLPSLLFVSVYIFM